MPPQNAFLSQLDKNKNGHNFATAHARYKIFFLKIQNTQVPIFPQYIILV